MPRSSPPEFAAALAFAGSSVEHPMDPPLPEGDSAEDMLDAGVLKGLARTLTDPHKFLYDLQKGLWAHHNKLSPNVV